MKTSADRTLHLERSYKRTWCLYFIINQNSFDRFFKVTRVRLFVRTFFKAKVLKSGPFSWRRGGRGRQRVWSELAMLCMDVESSPSSVPRYDWSRWSIIWSGLRAWAAPAGWLPSAYFSKNASSVLGW